LVSNKYSEFKLEAGSVFGLTLPAQQGLVLGQFKLSLLPI